MSAAFRDLLANEYVDVVHCFPFFFSFFFFYRCCCYTKARWSGCGIELLSLKAVKVVAIHSCCILYDSHRVCDNDL